MNKSVFFRKSVSILMMFMVNVGFVSSNLETFASKKVNKSLSKKEVIDVDELDSKDLNDKLSQIKKLEQEINSLKNDVEKAKKKGRDKAKQTKEDCEVETVEEHLIEEVKSLGAVVPSFWFNRAVNSLMEKYKISREKIVYIFFKNGGGFTVDNAYLFKLIWTTMGDFYNQGISTKFMEYLCENYKSDLRMKGNHVDLKNFSNVVDIYFSQDILLSKDILAEAFSKFIAKENIGEGNLLV